MSLGVSVSRRVSILTAGAFAVFTFVQANQAMSQNAAAPEPAAKRIATQLGASAPRQAVKRTAKRYFIEFRSRAAESYGHTFLVHGRVGQKIGKSDVVGLHPFTESPIPWMIGHLVAVPSETGFSDGDIEDQYITARYRVLLDEGEYRRVAAYMKDLQKNSPMWHAVLYNCNAFVADVAKFMGLKTPSTSLLMPKEFITELKELNTDTQTATAQQVQ